MSNIGWLFGWAKENGIEIPIAADGSANIPKLFELYDEWQRKNPGTTVVKTEISAATGFANKERKNTAHHIRHAKEMGFKNQDEYEKAAVEFFNGNRGKMYYNKARKRWYRYDEKTGQFCVSSDGIIHTFMKKSKKDFERKLSQEDLYEQ